MCVRPKRLSCFIFERTQIHCTTTIIIISGNQLAAFTQSPAKCKRLHHDHDDCFSPIYTCIFNSPAFSLLYLRNPTITVPLPVNAKRFKSTINTHIHLRVGAHTPVVTFFIIVSTVWCGYFVCDRKRLNVSYVCKSRSL